MAQRTTKKASAAQPAADLPPPPEGLTKEETRSVEKRRRLRAAVVYEIIRVEGEGELARTKSALWWSALGAGLSIGFSVLAMMSRNSFQICRSSSTLSAHKLC